MSVTSGFFNSINGDRRYNAEQMSSILDGVINDGVFSNIGTAFGVRAETGNTITVGIGRAWFNSTWLLNDAILPLTADDSEVILDRIDAVVIEIDHSESVREGSIKIVKGTPSSDPNRPPMIRTSKVNQYPLAYIYRAAGSSSITQANITSVIGTGSCPYITAILQVTDINNIVAQWKAQWDEWFVNVTSAGNDQMYQWMIEKQLEFNTWFGNLQTILEGDVATKLAEEILMLQNKFKVLAREYSIYETIDDSNDVSIEDSYGTILEGKILYKIV